MKLFLTFTSIRLARLPRRHWAHRLALMTATANKETIERLYAAVADRNGAAMTACYAPDAHFRDPAFGDLTGDDIGAMWRMLTGRARDLEITLREHEADENAGTAHWIARYTFST